MNQYGRLAMEHSRRHRPVAYAAVENPTQFFTQAGEEIQEQVTIQRDTILGSLRPGETIEEYRRRSYQALSTAEELTLADHYLFQTETDLSEEDPPDQAMDRYLQELARINEEFRHPD